MVKRFVDSELWQKEWFQDLSLKEKILVKYIFENCDCAGVWNANFKLASFQIGETVTLTDLENINSKKRQFEVLKDGNIFVLDFIKFQYGTLSEFCKPHKPVIEKLKKYDLFERVSKGYQYPLETLEEKEKEKDNLSFLGSSFLSESKPSEVEIHEFCKTLGRNIDVKTFVQYYDACNWCDKNGLPVNWKQKIISWVKNEKAPPSTENLKPHQGVTASEKYLRDLRTAPSDPMPESFKKLKANLMERI